MERWWLSSASNEVCNLIFSHPCSAEFCENWSNSTYNKMSFQVFQVKQNRDDLHVFIIAMRIIISTVAAVEISDRKDLNTLYKFRNLISVNRIFIKDYKVSVSIWHIRSESRVTFEMPQLSDLQKCVWLRDGVSIRAIAREINVDNVWVTFWETSLSILFTKLKVWRSDTLVSEFSTAATVHTMLSDICPINEQNIFGCSVANSRIKKCS
jgi:hypothetical protein